MKKNYFCMRKRILWFLTTVILCGTTAVALSSCLVNYDNPAGQTPLGDKIVGKWYAETPKQVTLGTGENAVECAKVVLCGTFDADGEGFWSLILVDKQNRAIQPVGKDGEEHPYWANCQYSVAGNTVNMKLTANYLPTSQMEWTFNYNGTCLQTKYKDRIIDLHPITTGEDAMFQEWMQQLGFGASADNYNINDKDITAENWRQTEAIYVYDGVGADVTDEKGRTGYTTVNLPWYEGTKQTNLPEGFCDDVTPEMGWEWVANYCGNRSVVNNNFFALYNKYTGILRFFYYMPQGTDTGNDHVWQVSMTDNLATHTTIPYGVPDDRTLTNKAAINQTGSGTYMDYITPWVDYRSNDGLIVPNDGWWAFDVDLSLTRPETISDDDNIKLQMRSWNTNHTSLYSTVEANIDGEMKGSFEGQTKTPLIASSSKGLFGRVGDLVKLGTKVKDAVTNLYSGNVASAIKGGIDLAKNGSSLASGKTKASGGATTGTFDGTFEGTINMMMNGTINTDGVIQGSAPTVGVASPTFYLKDFDTKNSHLGQGVWNLKKTPVVYRTNYILKELGDDMCLFTEFHKSPDEHRDYMAYNQFYFFDPSSIEVELNPNVFPESDIEWMQVDAVCGVRKGMMFNDTYAQALGIDNSKNDIEKNVYITPEHYFSFKHLLKNIGASNNMTYPYAYNYTDHDAEQMGCVLNKDDPSGFSITWVVGHGAGNYTIEPFYVVTDNIYHSYYGDVADGLVYKTPGYEISVSLTVKLKGVDTPFAFSRIYVPEIKNLDINNLGSIIENAEKKTNLSPKTANRTNLYDMQLSRLKDIYKYRGIPK